MRSQAADAFNKSVVNRAEKPRLIDEIASAVVDYEITQEQFQTYDPSYSRQVYYDLRHRAEEAFGAKRLVSILTRICQKLPVAA